MKALAALIALGRPAVALRALLTTGTAAFAAGGGLAAVAWGSLAALLLAAGTYTVDDWFDVAIDRHNRADRPLPSGRVSPRGALVFGLLALAGAVAAAAAASPAAGLMALAVAGGSFAVCSHQWGGRPNPCQHRWWLRSLTATLLVAAFAVLGMLAAGRPAPAVGLFAIAIALPHLGGRMLSDCWDRAGDARGGLNTLATSDPERALRWGLALLAATAIVLPLPAFFGFGRLYLILAVMLGGVLLAVVYAIWRAPHTAARYRRHFGWIMAAAVLIALASAAVRPLS